MGEHCVIKHPLCYGGAIFGAFTTESVELIAKYGLPGVEPYRGHLTAWFDQPQALKDLLDEYGIRLITASNGGPGQSTEFIDRSKHKETVADHVAFCRDFLKLFGCTHFKINMGSRPQNGTTAEEIKAIAETVTEIGKRTLEMGVTIAPHLHIWGPMRKFYVRAMLSAAKKCSLAKSVRRFIQCMMAYRPMPSQPPQLRAADRR